MIEAIPSLVAALTLGKIPDDKDGKNLKLPLGDKFITKKDPAQLIREAILGNRRLNQCIVKSLQFRHSVRGKVVAKVKVIVKENAKKGRITKVKIVSYDSKDSKKQKPIKDEAMHKCIKERIKSSTYQLNKYGTYVADVVIDIDIDPNQIIISKFHRLNLSGKLSRCFHEGKLHGTFTDDRVELSGIIKVRKNSSYGFVDSSSVKITSTKEFSPKDLNCFAFKLVTEIGFNLYRKKGEFKERLFKFAHEFKKL